MTQISAYFTWDNSVANPGCGWGGGRGSGTFFGHFADVAKIEWLEKVGLRLVSGQGP